MVISFKRYSKIVMICLACLVLCSFTLANVVDAAVGNATSHGSSSSKGSKSGSSSSSKSGSSSKSSSDSNSSSSNGNSSSSTSSSSSSGGSGYAGSTSTAGGTSRAAASTAGGILGGMLLLLIGLPVLVIIIIIVVIVYLKKKKGGITPDLPAAPERKVIKDPDYLRQAMEELKGRDPDFSEDLFISRINNMFVQLQEAWQAKDWKKVRPFESDELFNTHARQLQEFIDSNTTNVVDDIAILRTDISDYHDNGATESLDVYMRVRYKDYIIDDNTKKVIEGDPNLEIFMEYELAMSRKKGVATRLEQSTVVSTCPNCGANVSINASGECEYCGSVVSNGDFDWVLTRLDVLSQS